MRRSTERVCACQENALTKSKEASVWWTSTGRAIGGCEEGRGCSGKCKCAREEGEVQERARVFREGERRGRRGQVVVLEQSWRSEPAVGV